MAASRGRRRGMYPMHLAREAHALLPPHASPFEGTVKPVAVFVPVSQRVYRQLGLAIREQEFTAPAPQVFLRTIGEVAQKKRRI